MKERKSISYREEPFQDKTIAGEGF